MNTFKISLAIAFLVFHMSQVFAQQQSADTIAEAAGAYLGAVYALQAVKKTRCGYALLLNIGEYSQKAEKDVQSNLSLAYKNDLDEFISSSKHESQKLVADNIRLLDGRIDEKTQCGLVVGMLLGNLTQYWTEWEKIKR